MLPRMLLLRALLQTPSPKSKLLEMENQQTSPTPSRKSKRALLQIMSNILYIYWDIVLLAGQH